MKLLGAFSQLQKRKILVAGDLLLDTYTIGKARRISPEAPVAIVNVLKTQELAGGAGNTILNLISLGAEVVCLGRVGKDFSGEKLIQSLKDESVDTSGIVIDPQFSTPIKNRIVADNQQIVRIDHETVSELSSDLEAKVIDLIPYLLTGVDVVAISDYGKGFLSDQILKALIFEAHQKNIYVIADPKGSNFSRYGDVDLLKPNKQEAYAACRLGSSASLTQVAKTLFKEIEAKALLITRSEEGISLFTPDGNESNFSVNAKEVKDVTGAGDTVLATLAVAIANQLPIATAIQLSNIAAGIAIEHFGCARVTMPQLAKRLLETDCINKVFDIEHLYALKQALHQLPYVVVEIPGDTPPTPSLIAKLTKMKEQSNHAVIASMGEPICEDIVHMAAAIKPIDFILLSTPEELLAKHFPCV